MKRVNISTGTKWEPIVGYSRAVKIGNLIYISGTTATDAKGNIIGKNDPYKQALKALENIKIALEKCGATIEDVVRTRMFVTKIDNWNKIGKAHGEVFKEIRPVTSMIEIKGLIDPDMLVEIEADAVIRE